MKLFLLATAIPLVLLIPNNALAWDFGQPSWFGGGFQGFHHRGFDTNYGCGAYCQGERDAVYDHTQGLVYNPYPQCCHSKYYQQAFHQGYDDKWNTYQSQEQQTNQRSNIYINNSPGAYVNTEQNSNQEQSQSQVQGQGPSWSGSPQCQQCDCGCSSGWGLEP